MLDFYNSSTWAQQVMGRADGKAALHMGEGFVGKEMDKWASTPEIKEAYPRVGDYITKTLKEWKAADKDSKVDGAPEKTNNSTQDKITADKNREKAQTSFI